MGCQNALLEGWIFPTSLWDGGSSNDGNGCLWSLSGPPVLGVPSFPPPPIQHSSAALVYGLVQGRGGGRT